jgi:hypothetical protein
MKAELIPTMLYGDGRAQDVGTDRALANNYNKYIDYKSAHQSPALDVFGAQGSGIGQTDIWPAFFRPLYLGSNTSSATVKRVLSVAPYFKSQTGSLAGVVVVLSAVFPQPNPSTYPLDGMNPAFTGASSRAEWTTTSTTIALGTPADLDIVKDPVHGISWLFVGTYGDCRCLGLGQLIERYRVVG